MNSKIYLLFVPVAALAAQSPAGLREAARLDQAGKCAEAGKIYDRALAQGSPRPSLLNNVGNHYLVCGQPEKALHYFERLVRVVPSHRNANLQLARLAMDARQFARAEELLQNLAAWLPGDFDVLSLLGRASARTGNLPRARESLEAALRLRPNDAVAMLEGGLANASLGDYPRAVFLLARAQSRAPDQPEIALALARASEEAGYYGDAVLAYDRYLGLRPKDESARRDRAHVLAHTATGREQGARALQRYVTANPRDALGHVYLAQILWSEDPDGALASLAQAVRLDERLVPAHVARAWLLHRMGRDSEALPHLEAALRVSPEDVRALDQLGLVLLSLARVPEAEAAFRRAAALAPDDADVALHLGRALMDRGNDQEAQQWFDASQKLRPARQRDARREAGMIELATLDPAGRRAREIQRFRSMARSRPDDPLLQLHLAGLLLADGQLSESLREYRTLLTLNADTDIWAQAGKALLQSGQHEAARPFLERAGSSLDYSAAALLASGGPDAALALAKEGRYRESLDLLARSIAAAPADAELRLTEAIVLALSNDRSGAEQRLKQVQARWPEWDRPWFVHGLVLVDARLPKEAASRFRAAAALGSREEPSSCTSLRAWAFNECGK